MRFRDRTEAGQLLAQRLTSFADKPDVLVLALPRGGVPVAYEISRRLNSPLDVWMVRKLGAPGIPELAIGAIASGGIQIIRPESRGLGVSQEQFEAIASAERQELARREAVYRGDRPPVDVRGHTVILVDDGIATGASMRAAIDSVRQQTPAAIVVAVPVAGYCTCTQLARKADHVVCLWTPQDLSSVGEWYAEFAQTTDEEVCALLERSRDVAHRLEYQASRP